MDKLLELLKTIGEKDEKNWKTTWLGNATLLLIVLLGVAYAFGKITDGQYALIGTIGGGVLSFFRARVTRDVKVNAELKIKKVENANAEKVESKTNTEVVSQANTLFVILLGFLLLPLLAHGQSLDYTPRSPSGEADTIKLLPAGEIYNNDTAHDVAIVPMAKLRKIVAMKLSYDSIKSLYIKEVVQRSLGVETHQKRWIMYGVNVSVGADYTSQWGMAAGSTLWLGFLDNLFGFYFNPHITYSNKTIAPVLRMGAYLTIF